MIFKNNWYHLSPENKLVKLLSRFQNVLLICPCPVRELTLMAIVLYHMADGCYSHSIFWMTALCPCCHWYLLWFCFCLSEIRRSNTPCHGSLATFVVVGKPLHIKTDNGPGYTSTAFKAFCSSYKILHTTDIPYNPQGQATVEWAHQTLRVQSQRQEGGASSLFTQINKALFTLNFLNCS
jgi:hypothetical protein